MHLAYKLRTLRAVLGALPPSLPHAVQGRIVQGFPLPQWACAGAEAALDAAATVLRLLYLRDLRALQTQIDEALVRVQARAGVPGGPAQDPRPWQALHAEHSAAICSWACGAASLPVEHRPLPHIKPQVAACLVVDPPACVLPTV